MGGSIKTNWLVQSFPYYELIRILNFYLDLDCWLIPVENLNNWYAIRIHSRSAWPLDYDHAFGKREERMRFNLTRFEKVIKERKTICDTRNGLSDFFVPVIKNEKVVGILEFGDFLKKAPSREMLVSMWKDLTGYEAAELNQDFLTYARVILETPVVEGVTFRALQEILELYAKVLAGEGDFGFVCRRTDELKERVFARNYPHKTWLDKVIKNNRVYPPTWFLGKISRFEREELGIQRLPTSVIAVMVDEPRNQDQDELDFILQNYHFQREMFKYSKTLPNTAAIPLGDYGMLFFTSPDPERGEVQAKLEILDKIDVLSRFAVKELKIKVLAGVSRCSRPGENISRVYREAVTVLGFCRPLGRPILFYEDVRTNPTIPNPPNFFQWSKQLIDAYANGAVGETEMSRNQYVEQILSQSAGRPEMVRLHFFYVFGQILDILRKRTPLQSDSFQFLFESFERQLQEADTIVDLISVFRESLRRLLEMTLKPMEGTQTIRLEAAKKYIEENYNLDLKLEDVARHNGFSVSVFGRSFKKTAGMGFSAYLRKTRLEQAKKLLASTRLPISRVSQECGFNNLQYFFDVFKRSTGRTPQEFRDFSTLKTPSQN